MSQRQWKRLDAVERIGRGTLTVREAAEVVLTVGARALARSSSMNAG